MINEPKKWGIGQWNAYVAFGETAEDRRRRLDMVPRHWKNQVNNHIKTMLSIKDRCSITSKAANANEILVTAQMKGWASEQSAKHKKGRRFDESVNKKDSVYIGYLGEAIFWSKNQSAQHANVSEFDFLLNGDRYEIKTYWSQYQPKQNYFLKIPEQDCSRIDAGAIYCFICVDTNNDRAWILGYISVKEFNEISKFRKKGSLQKGSGFRYTTDCQEIQVNQLYTVEKII